MCVVSVIHQYFNGRPEIDWNQQQYIDLREVLIKAAKLDTDLGEPDCADEGKTGYLKELEKTFCLRKQTRF